MPDVTIVFRLMRQVQKAMAYPGRSSSVTFASSPATKGFGGTPIWLSVVLALLTLTGVVAAAWLLRRTGSDSRTSAEELDRRDKREETMRTLRWAAVRAISTADRERRVGIAALVSLGGSEWLEPEDRNLIRAVIEAALTPAATAYIDVEHPIALRDDDEDADADADAADD